MKLVKALRTYGRKPICVKNWLLTARVLVGQEWVRGYSVTEDWYRFESDRRAEITVFTLEGTQARAGAKATRFFKKHVGARTGRRTKRLRRGRV
jgi:hypothetical protein